MHFRRECSKTHILHPCLFINVPKNNNDSVKKQSQYKQTYGQGPHAYKNGGSLTLFMYWMQFWSNLRGASFSIIRSRGNSVSHWLKYPS